MKIEKSVSDTNIITFNCAILPLNNEMYFFLLEYMEMACEYPDSELEIHPFAYRTHAHTLGMYKYFIFKGGVLAPHIHVRYTCFERYVFRV